jgi:hypothetical protein
LGNNVNWAVVSGICKGYGKPLYQGLVSGNPADGVQKPLLPRLSGWFPFNERTFAEGAAEVANAPKVDIALHHGSRPQVRSSVVSLRGSASSKVFTPGGLSLGSKAFSKARKASLYEASQAPVAEPCNSLVCKCLFLTSRR